MYSDYRGLSPLRHRRLLSIRENINWDGRQRTTRPWDRQRAPFAFAAPFV